LLPGIFFSKLFKPREKKVRASLLNNKGQNLIEYAIVIALVAAAMVAMSTYIFRSTQAVQKQIEKEMR